MRFTVLSTIFWKYVTAMTQDYTASSTVISVKEYQGFQTNGSTKPTAVFAQNNITNNNDAATFTVADAIAQMLESLGVEGVYGVAGGAMATLWGALSNSNLQVLNFRHEAGAAFAAVEAYFASNSPTVVFTTAGPGITNALTGLFAAKGEGAKVIFLSACTTAAQRGRWAIQETSTDTLPSSGIFTSGILFNYAVTVESAAQLPQIFRKLACGLSQPGGFVAHLSIPTAIQTSLMTDISLPKLDVASSVVTPSSEAISHSIELLSQGQFAIWIGFGARNAAEEIRQFAERTGAAVMCSPRGKGIFPEDHPQFVGVTGLGGHSSVITYMSKHRPLHILVLGTRLSEPTSFWSPDLLPDGGFVHVDIDAEVPGVAYPNAEVFPVIADIKSFLRAILQYFPKRPTQSTVPSLPNPERKQIENTTNSPVRPQALMEAIQKVIIDGSDAVVLAECGNSFTWSTHLLHFNQANRYRVSTGVGAMGHAVAGVVGTAKARNGKAVAIVGDGAMLMNNEINTAVKYGIPAVWIVLNDARYNMCSQGMKMLGLQGADATIPEADFVMIARGMGADGIRVEKESDIHAALEKAITAKVPFIIDVLIDANVPAPSKGRNKGLAVQGVKPTITNTTPAAQISFPNV
jgi:thiamine pyrophosphate-dependent acetolactate synthase large subunit-like protein